VEAEDPEEDAITYSINDSRFTQMKMFLHGKLITTMLEIILL